ncbi:MAG TPA: amino acid permease [Ferruginibacter sp.]|nr:amino acid permease [Ferruginibacter sp.]
MPEEKETTTDRSKIPLNRVLGLFTSVLLVSGIMIGSGVFKKIIPMSQTGLSEGWILGAWIIAGIITMFGAFTISALSSLTEQSGGIYEYLRLSFGNFFSFLFGWTDFTIIGPASIAALGYIFAQTVNSFVPLANPLSSLEHISIGIITPFLNSGIKLLAIAAIALLTWINYLGVKKGGAISNVITSAKILGILIIIVFGLSYSVPAISSAAENIAAPATLNGMAFFSAMFGAMLSAFWAYDGWSNITYMTGEIKNPKRNLPLAIMIGVGIAMFLYVVVNYAYMNVLSLQQLAAVDQNTIGAVVVAETMIGSTGRTLIVVLIMVSVFGSLNGVIMAHTRVYFQMAREKYFFKNFAKAHPKYRTPYISLFYTFIWSSVLVMSGTFDILTDMVIFAGFLFYAMVALALFKMKGNGMIKTKVIGYPVIPVILILFSAALIVNTFMVQTTYSLIGLGLILTGVPFYFYFKRKNSLTGE